MKMRSLLVVSLVAAIGSGQAIAGTPTATMNIVQSDGTAWTENLVASGLVSVNGSGNLVMKQGANVGDYITTDNIDFWQWQGSGWTWHSAQTIGGTTLSIADQLANPNQDWAAEVTLTKISGHGDPDMAYGYSVKNNTAVTQTYTFSTGESIVPPVGTPAQVYADVSYTLANTDGSATLAPVGSAVQSFMLSADGGMTFSNAGVDVGNAVTANTKGSSSWGPYSATAPSPGGTWNYMQIVSRFTLTPYKDVATISGTASITPIPEPESYAMLLAGLGMVGFMARRRRVL